MNRIGLGCMGMARRNEESSIRTVDTALDHGVTMFNVGEFYNGGESEIVLGNALRQHPRDKYFVSVKFGALPSREALYGVDMNPFNVRAHLTYSLSRLGLDYVDQYEPARMDDAYSVEEVIEAVNELVKEGLVRHVGMTECTAEELRRGNEICPIKYFEKEYSLLSRKMEEEDLPTCRELGIPVVAYGLLGHGLLTDGFATGERTPHVLPFLFRPEDMEHNRAIVQQLKEIADGKGCSTSNLAVAWVLQKNPDMLDMVVDGLIASALRTKAPGHRSYTDPKLSATIHKLTGLTLPELRMHWHMQVARDLLRYTELPLTEVMQRCGYTSLPTFSRTVRRWWGVSPQHLRILARNSGDIGKYAL